MNHQECIFKKYLIRYSVDKVLADKDLYRYKKTKSNRPKHSKRG